MVQTGTWTAYLPLLLTDQRRDLEQPVTPPRRKTSAAAPRLLAVYYVMHLDCHMVPARPAEELARLFPSPSEGPPFTGSISAAASLVRVSDSLDFQNAACQAGRQ